MGNYDKNLLDRIAASDMSGEAAEFIPADAPFADDQRAWLNGMFSGLQTMIDAARANDTQATAAAPLKIFFGSQSGTSESLAKDLRKFAAARGFETAIAELDYSRGQYKSARTSLDTYFKVAQPTPQALLLAAKVEQKLGSRKRSRTYAQMLRESYPNSPEARQL